MDRPAVDFGHLESGLRALASENRLRILAMLATPTTLDRIRLTPGAAHSGDSPGRPISRPAVLGHLRPLLEQGLVQVRRAARPRGPGANEYVADRSRIYALLEELGTVARLGSPTPFEPTATRIDVTPRRDALARGARLVLVRGAYEGRAYPLGATRRQGRWDLGRRQGSHVCLDYDAYVSQDHCIITLDRGLYWIEARPGAKNGTWLNWEPVPPGDALRLESGDVISVGHSLLVFRAS